MTKPKQPTCGSCMYYWFEPGESEAVGLCRRYPPIIVYEDVLDGEQPAVHSGGWCGEWADKARRVVKNAKEAYGW